MDWPVPLVFVLSLLAGVGLLLFGLRLLSEGLQGLLTGPIRRIFQIVDQNPVKSFLSGILTSALIQSRTSASIMAISFANSGTLNLKQVYFFLVGAGIGTLPTVGLFALQTGYLDLLFLALGAWPLLYSQKDGFSSLGRLIFSVGLLLVAFDIVGFAYDARWDAYLEQSGLLASDMNLFMQVFVLAFVVGLNLLVRSTVALAAAVFALMGLGMISSSVAVTAFWGIHLGAMVPPLVSARRSLRPALRALLGLFSAQLVLVAVGIAFLNSAFLEIVSTPVEVSTGWLRYPAFYGVKAYVGIGLYLMAGSLLLSPLVLWGMPLLLGEPREKEMQKLEYLGRPSHLAPSLALEQVKLEVIKLAAMVQSILQMLRDQSLVESPQELQNRLFKYEKITDNVLIELKEYLVKIQQTRMTKTQSREAGVWIKVADELESLADTSEDITTLLQSGSVSGRKALNAQLERVLMIYEGLFHHITEGVALTGVKDQILLFRKELPAQPHLDLERDQEFKALLFQISVHLEELYDVLDSTRAC